MTAGEYLERNRIYHSDCLDVLRKLPEKSVDLVIADPPYYRMPGGFLIIGHDPRELPYIPTGFPLWIFPFILPAAPIIRDADGILIDFMQRVTVKPQKIRFIPIGRFCRPPCPIVPDNQIPLTPIKFIQNFYRQLINHPAASPTVKCARRL